MRRLLVLLSATAAIVTIPALASADNTTSSPRSIGSVITGPDGARAADYWTRARMASARELPPPLIRGEWQAKWPS